jgi:hypothetical protein
MRTELVTIPTDTLPLDGAFYEPDGGATAGAVLLLHHNTMKLRVDGLSGKLLHPYPVNPLADRISACSASPISRRKTPSRPCQRTRSPTRSYPRSHWLEASTALARLARLAAPPNPLTCLPVKPGRIAVPWVPTTAMLAVTVSSTFL